ncbi:MAG: T9SS type A sorting domain-containing protein [Bacteroidia bacterium]
MRKILFSVFAVIFTLSISAQDIGVGELIYPYDNYAEYELSSYVPVYWNFKNYGDDTLENRVITLELLAEGSSPRFTQFRANITKDFVGPIDDRDPVFYQYGFHELFGIESVMGIITPEHAAGDTIEICVIASVEGDVDRSNDTACFHIVLKEWQNRDLVVHILNPEPKSEVHPNHSVTFDLGIRNAGEVTYTRDSVYLQMAFEKDGQTMDLVNVAKKIDSEIISGDSAIITLDVPLSKNFPLGDFYVGFRVAWLSDDGVFELGESNTDNNIRYTQLSCMASSIADLPQLNLKAFYNGESIIVSGDFFNASELTSTLYSLNGQVIDQQKQSINQNTTIAFNYNLATTGAYILVLKADNGRVFSQKVYID